MRRLVLTALIVLLALPATAAAGPVDAIYDDCQDGRLDKRHSKPNLRKAKQDMPADLDEYTNCRELINAALQNRRGVGGAGEGSTEGDDDGVGALPAGEGGLPLGPDSRPIDPRGVASPEERKALDSARISGLEPAAASASLPLPLIILLVLTGGAALAVAAPRLRDLVRRRLA